jgi:hypothetical protein
MKMHLTRRGYGTGTLTYSGLTGESASCSPTRQSLYTFLIPKVLKANLKNIEDEFLIHLSYNLQNEGFGLEVINRVMQEYHEIGFARTSNRQVLGSMNEFAFEYDYLIRREGGVGKHRNSGTQ